MGSGGRKYIPVEDVLDVTESRLWYYIPGFKGYEVSNDGYVRSMKHYRTYPFGIIVKKKKDGNDPSYELTSDNGERNLIHLSQIVHLVKTSNYNVSGYPRATCITNWNARYDKRLDVTKREKINKSKTKLDAIHYHKFKVVQNGDEAYGMYRTVPDVRTPIKSAKGDKYYGREDCRSFSNFNV